MNERKMLAVLIVLQACHYATAMFFHEPSSIIMQGSGAEEKSDFGFAMTFMEGFNILVVGAPKVDSIGKIYSCFIDYDIKETCGENNILASDYDYTDDEFPNQNFYMGSTVVATSDYFFTCAPLWTTKISATDRTGPIQIEDAFGTCFMKNPKTNNETRFHGLLERYKKLTPGTRNTLKISRFTGGTGWTTLLDEENKLLLIAKTSLEGDFIYLNSSHIDRDVVSLLDDRATQHTYYMYFSNYYNIGFGVTGGKFFSKETVYAYSMLQKNMQGVIGFLTYRRRTSTSGKLSLLCKGKCSQTTAIQLKSYDVGTMFGNTMAAADLNMDGLDELLVAAPAQSQDECFECGALHIYIGGDMNTINEQKRQRSILASTHFGRFGTAIATNDIDGDGKPDIVVSAPFENQGRGAIYILSGYEVYHTLMKTQDYKSIQLTDMKMTQRIHKEPQRMLGFSLQFLPDTDENGCGELAVGSPGTSQVLVFKCVQKINVTLSSRIVGEQIVREQDTQFVVQVCARVQLPEKPVDIVGNITIETDIIGEAAVVRQPNVVIDITCWSCPTDRKDICENVIVDLKDKEKRHYTLNSKAKLQNNYLLDNKMKVFNESWVEASPHSKLETSLIVFRHCSGNDCDPNLSMELMWSGSESYVLGSSANETATIRVRNDGNASYSACVWLRVVGAPLAQAGCPVDNGGFQCDLSSPLKRDAEESIPLLLDMTNPKNVEENLIIEVKLYENCNQKNVVKSNKTLTIPFNLTSDNIFNERDTHKLNITDKQILEKTVIFDHHEYVIRNNGSIRWEKVKLDVELETRPYIESFDILNTDNLECEENYNITPTAFIRHCNVTLPPNTTQVVVATIGIMAGRLKGFVNGPELNVTSMSKLFLTRAPTLSNTSITEIIIQKELSLKNNKLMIGLIAAFVALIILAILAFILYKCGFFKRKQQQQLIVAKESIRRKSVRRNTHVSAVDGPAEGLQMDVDDDSPFEEARPVTTFDDVGLVDKDEN